MQRIEKPASIPKHVYTTNTNVNYELQRIAAISLVNFPDENL